MAPPSLATLAVGTLCITARILVHPFATPGTLAHPLPLLLPIRLPHTALLSAEVSQCPHSIPLTAAPGTRLYISYYPSLVIPWHSRYRE